MYGGSNRNSYADLMTMASRNAAAAHRKVAGLNVDRPKKEDPRQVRLKEGVKKFLAKREEEDKMKKDEERKKKENLLQLRQQDRKAANRVRKMLTMTKSANKSCVEDARESLNESVSAQTHAGDFQPDEDDYGYTSNFADEMHKKMLDKYKSIPVKPAFPQERGVFVPKPQSLQKRGTSWRKNDTAHYEDQDEQYSPEQNYEEPVPPKKSKVVSKPPPMDYRKLLEMAQQKTKEPAPPIHAIPEKMEREVFEYGRPMTAKEKAAYLSEKELRERAQRRHGLISDKNNNNNSKTSSSDMKSENGNLKQMPSFKIPRSKQKEEEVVMPPPPPKQVRVAEPETHKPPSREKESHRQRPSGFTPPNGISGHTSPSTSKLHSMLTKPNGVSKMQAPRPSSSLPTKAPEKFPKLRQPTAATSSPPAPKFRESQKASVKSPRPEFERTERRASEKLEIIKEKLERPKYLSEFEGRKDKFREREREMEQPRQQPRKQQQQQISPRDSGRPKPGSSRDDYARTESRERPKPGNPKMSYSNTYDEQPMKRPERREMPIKQAPRMRDEPMRMKQQPKPSRARAIIDSDEEYDSEMDDFIDDSEADMGTISDEISRIFNYDRRRFAYHDEESDDECMESSVEQQMREENRSLRIGIQEDKEEELREEMERKRKMMKKKNGGR